MAFPHNPPPINHFISITFIFFFFTILAQGQAQAILQPFKFVNKGELEDPFAYIEYDATYRCLNGNNTATATLDTYPFRLCFYNTTPNAYTLAIRVGTPNYESRMRWVWDANRNNPVGENAALTLTPEGNLVLSDMNGHVAWQTNTANKGVTGIKMLPNGNLILHDKNGNFVWQSFDHPTDTLLIGQSLKINGINKLVSRTSDIDGSDGKYSIVLEKTGINLYIKTNDGDLLKYNDWGKRTNVTKVTFNVIPAEEGNTNGYQIILDLQTEGLFFLKKLNYNATLSFFRLESNGNIKAYSYYDKVSYSRWEETFAFFSSYYVRECRLPSKCGAYGLCDKGMCIACPSPKGLLGWSESCKPPVLAQTCKNGGGGGGGGGGKGKVVDYYKLEGVEHYLGPKYIDGVWGSVNVEECRKKCDKDCKCLGFFYKEDNPNCLLAPLLGTLMKVTTTTSVGYIKYTK